MEVSLFRPPTDDDPEFVPVAVTYAAAAVRYTERFFTYGDFEITMSAAAPDAHKFQKYLLVRIDGAFWGIILSIERALNAEGNTLKVYGTCLKGLTSTRFTLPPTYSDDAPAGTAGFDVANGTTEHCMKHFMRSNFFTETSPTRLVPGLVIAPDKGRGIADDKYMTRFDELHIVLRELGEAAGLGYTITPELGAGALVFDCDAGVDRSYSQSDNARVMFSTEFRNIASMEYRDDDTNMRNLFYTTQSGAKFEDEAYTATYTRGDEPLPRGMLRREQHLEISASHPEAGQDLDELKRLAMIRAESYKTARTLTAEILETRSRYNADFRLGDIVTVQNEEWGIGMHARIVEVTTDASGGGLRRTATFGEAPLNFIDRLRRQIRGG